MPRSLLALAAFCAALAPFGAIAQDRDAGRQLFRTYCVTCHGMEGLGDGPMTQVLTIEPPNLTRLSADNDGIFPISRVVSQIDGRMPVLSHGGPMPLFGGLFEGQSAILDAEDGSPILTSADMVDVVSYLETLQQQ